MSIRVLVGDCLDVLPTLPSESVHMCVTSPPYYGLRDYGTALWGGGDAECDHLNSNYQRGGGPSHNSGQAYVQAQRTPMRDTCTRCGATRIDKQIGLEATPGEWVAKMVAVFREVRRVLRPDGTLWLNVGDSYAANRSYQVTDNKHIDVGNNHGSVVPPGCKPKDLIGIPWMLAFALRADGWYLRADIIWSKPNPMPESVVDRPTKAHEYLFLLSKSRTYYYDADAIREPLIGRDPGFIDPGNDRAKRGEQIAHDVHRGSGGHFDGHLWNMNPAGRNKRSVWTIATEAFSEAHFATYPTALVEPCIKAGTSEKGCCPTCGAPWVRIVEREASKPARENYHGAGVVPVHRGGGDRPGGYYPTTPNTTGWRLSCSCRRARHVDCRDTQCNHFGVDEPIPCTILDPFGGAGTTGLVADRLNRNAILIELNSAYAEMARRRLTNDAPMFAEVWGNESANTAQLEPA